MARTVFWLLGGALCATGIMTLLFSFGAPYGDFATGVDRAGWDGMGDIATTGWAKLAFGCLLLGVPILIGLNATAWKKTGGY